MNTYYCFGFEDDCFYILSAETEEQARASVSNYGDYPPDRIRFIQELKYPVEDFIYFNCIWLDCMGDGEFEMTKMRNKTPHTIVAGHEVKSSKQPHKHCMTKKDK